MKPKRLLWTLALLCLVLVLILPGKAQAATEGCFTYTATDGAATITDCAPSATGAVTIPATLGGYPVTGIESYAFSQCTRMTSVTVPNSVTTIGKSAFFNCYSLESMTLPFVGGSAKTANDTDQYPFGYIFGDGLYLDSVKVTQYYYGTDLTATTYDDYYLPATLKSVTITGGDILYGAFYNCKNLETVILPEGPTRIGSSAFRGCKNLKSVNIPNTVTTIGNQAFRNCSSLTEIVVPNSVISIATNAFAGCGSLESMTLPFVGESAKTPQDTYQYPLGYLFGLSSYTGGVSTTQYYHNASTSAVVSNVYYIPASLKTVTITGGDILYGAFYNCSNLTTVTIPGSATAIADRAFYGCTGLQKVVYCGTQKQWGALSIGSDNAALTSATLQYHNYDPDHCTACGVAHPDLRLDFVGRKTAATLGLEDMIYVRATVAFTNAEGTADTEHLTKEQILANGKVLFWHENNMPGAPEEAVLGTENMRAVLTDAGVYAGLQEYHAISHGIHAKQYTDTVYFRTYIKVDGLEYYGPINEYSVVTYAKNQLNNPATTTKVLKLKAVLSSMLHYGAAAQAQFNYKPNEPANACLWDFAEQGLLDQALLDTHWDESMMNIRGAVPAEMAGCFIGNGVTRTNRTLNLAGAIYARLVFGLNVTNGFAAQPAEGTTVTFYFWSEKDYDKLAAAGTALSKSNATYTHIGTPDYSATYGYEYLSDSEGIAAKQMRDTIYVACVFAQPDGTEYTSNVEVYNAHVYAQAQLDKDSSTETLKRLLKAMVVYGEAAKAFFG